MLRSAVANTHPKTGGTAFPITLYLDCKGMAPNV